MRIVVMSGPTSKVKRLETIALIKEISERLLFPEDTIQIVLDTLVAIITESLLEEKKVIIRRFGVFRLSRRGTAIFRTSLTLKQKFKEQAMEKYGVEMNNETVLLAKITGECPECKQLLQSKDPPQCSTCGTKPFEKKGLKGA